MEESKPRKKMGRPPAGVMGKGGVPELVSEYPKLAVSVRPETRAKLNATAMLENRPAWQIVDDSIAQYVERMPDPDRRAVEALAKRSIAKDGTS